MSVKTTMRLLLLVMLAGLLGYLGFLYLRERDPLPHYTAALAAYGEAGKSCEERREYADAAAHYDRAYSLLENAYRRLNGLQGMDAEQTKAIGGKILDLKAKALRDKHYALALAAGKPLPEATDSVTGESFRNIFAIPDSKDRDEAAACLRGAALHYSPSDLRIQTDALRLTLMRSPLLWEHVEKFSRAILAVKPDDSRAKLYLAKFHYEQPLAETGLPLPPLKRSRDRLELALKLVDEVRADRKFPVWRTELLRANIHYTLMKSAPNKKAALAELKALDHLLFDSKDGDLSRLQRGDGFERLGPWDGEGILGLYALAADIAITLKHDAQDPQDPGFIRSDDVLPQVFSQTIRFVESKAGQNDPAFPRSMLAATVLNAMVTGQSLLALEQPKDWRDGFQLLRRLFKDEFDADRCDPTAVGQFVELLMREAHIARRRGEKPGQSEELRAEATQWLGEGFKFGQRHGLNDRQLLPLNLLKVNVGFLNGDRREEVAPYLEALRRTGLPQTTATALMIDGAYDEREGRLVKARDKIENAVKVVDGDEQIRGHAVLANIYMALGRPDLALVDLLQLQPIYDRFDELAQHEKEWLSTFLRSPAHYRALVVIASLESSRAKRPAQPSSSPAEFNEHEERARRILKRELHAQTGPGFTARAAWVYHLTLTNRLKDANDEWQALNKLNPDRLEMLNLKIGLIEREAALKAAASHKPERPTDAIDALILDFIKSRPRNQSAQLYYATWLAHTRRTDEARAYLKDIVNRSPLTPETRRVASAILLTLHSDVSPLGLARHLPRDPNIDQALLNLNLSAGESQAKVREALSRHESVGLTRVMQADDLYLQGHYAKAADAFAASVDFSRLRGFALQGLLRSIFSLATQDSQAALTTVQRLTTELPDEPALLLAYAYVLLVRDEIGAATDDWATTKTMGSALNAWEKNLPAKNEGLAAAALTRAEFWARAHRVDNALNQAKRAVKLDRKNPATLSACAAIFLHANTREVDADLRECLVELQRLAPTALAVRRLQARAAENSQDFDAAIEIYQQLLADSPRDREANSGLIALLEAQKKFPEALKRTAAWRQAAPNDVQAVAAEIRCLVRTDEVRRAVEIADAFAVQTRAVGVKRGQDIKDPTAKTKLADDAQWLPQLEIARAFFAAGAFAEADRRLAAMPAAYTSAPAARQLLAEIAIKQNQWAKAESILDAIVRQTPRNFDAVNNLAYLIAVNEKDAPRARGVLLASLKTETGALAVRATDGVSPEFLHTVGTIYTTLANPHHGRELLQLFTSLAPRFPTDPRIELYAGYAHELTGDPAQARDSYERALAKLPTAPLTPEIRTALSADANAFLERVNAKLKTAMP